MKTVQVEGTDHSNLIYAARLYLEKGNSRSIQQIIDALGEAPAVGFDEWFADWAMQWFPYDDIEEVSEHKKAAKAGAQWQAAQAQQPVVQESSRNESAIALLNSWMTAPPDEKIAQEFKRYLSEVESEQAQQQCTWREDASPDLAGTYNTDCGNSFTFSNDGPVENGVKFCCYCGKPLPPAPEGE